MADDEALTIDELARRTGMTVRNIRAHQSRGLVPPPVLRGRTGYYGPEHVARIELIRELQAEGFNLEGIRRLLAGAGGSGDEVVRFTRAVREPFDEPGREITLAELSERWGTSDPKILARAEKLGLVRRLAEGWY
ncbi:MAG: helix-turn-helix domain-containing protein, partial [Thermoleophilaceae bacterium]